MILLPVLLVIAGARPSAALVITHPAQVDEAARESARQELKARFELLEDPSSRAALEGDEAPLAEAQQALGQARQALRRFEMDSARRSLTVARERVGLLAPTSEARALAVEIRLREAELELVEARPAEVARHLGAALSIDPALTLDPELYAPPLIEQLKQARAQREKAAKVAVRVDSVPTGARLVAAGIERCCTPLTVELSRGSQVLWLQRDRSRPALLRLMVSSPGPLSIPLAPESKAQRLKPLVDAWRAAEGPDQPAAAAALREALGVDVLAALDRAGAPPRTFERPVAVVAPPVAVAPAPAAPGLLQRRWPVVAAAVVAAGLVAGGAAMGASASRQAQEADGAPFASVGQAQWNEGARTATVANTLYGGAAVAGAAGVLLFFVF